MSNLAQCAPVVKAPIPPAPQPTRTPTWVVYALCDPRVDDKIQRVRYVGVTKKGAATRLSSHIAEARGQKQTPKCDWIRQVLSSGQRPSVEILDSGHSMFGWDSTEIAWIERLSEIGCPLTNLDAGGGGGIFSRGNNRHEPVTPALWAARQKLAAALRPNTGGSECAEARRRAIAWATYMVKQAEKAMAEEERKFRSRHPRRSEESHAIAWESATAAQMRDAACCDDHIRLQLHTFLADM